MKPGLPLRRSPLDRRNKFPLQLILANGCAPCTGATRARQPHANTPPALRAITPRPTPDRVRIGVPNSVYPEIFFLGHTGSLSVILPRVQTEFAPGAIHSSTLSGLAVVMIRPKGDQRRDVFYVVNAIQNYAKK